MKKLVLSLFILLTVSITVFGQDRTVTGTVTAREDGLPIPGATVRVKEVSGLGTSTSADGKFSISVPASGRTLVVSFLGYTSQDVAIGSGNSVNVTLESDAKSLEEVVVTAGGISVKRAAQGYTSTIVKAAELTQAKATNVGAALSGKVAGLQVNTVGSGVNPTVRLVLRGNRSLLGNNQALVVLDNNIVPSSVLTNLNPEDIDDIQVLNGAGAAALYGSDASNGALIITTKKGKNGPAVIRLSNTTSFEQVSFYPEMQKRFGSGTAEDFAEYVPYENQQYGPAFDGQPRVVGKAIEDGSIQTLPYAYNDSKYDFWDTGVTNQTDFSLSSGDDKSSLYLAGQYVDVSGTTPKDKYNRVSLRANGFRDLGNKFSIDYNTNYVQNRYDRTTQTAAMYDQILQTPGQIPLTSYSDWENNPFANPNGYYNEYYANPYYTLDNNRENIRNDYFIGSAELKWNPLDFLRLTYRVGVTAANQSSKSYVNKFLLSPYTKSIGTSQLKSNDIPGSVNDQSSYDTQLTSDLLATINKPINDDINLTFTAGASLRNNNEKSQNVSANSLVIRDLFNVDERYTPNVTGTENNQNTRRLGLYGDLLLGYKNYLYLHVTGRNDWISVLSPENRSFFYPALDVSFIPTNLIESLKDTKVISNLKLRAGISRVGQANIAPYSLNPTFSQASGYPFSSGPGYGLDSRIVSLNLEPEITEGIEAGFDADFWDNRISSSFTYYSTRTTNQTVPAGVSRATGFSSYLVNTGEVANSGIETTLSVTPIRTSSGFSLTVGGNYVYNDNEVLSISSDLERVGLSTGARAQAYAITGMLYPVLLGTDYIRDDQGRVIVDAQTGYPTANPAQTVLGNTNPKHRLGLTTNIRYKNLAFNALFEYRGGFVIYNSGAGSFDFSGSNIRTTYYNRERFVFPNSSYLDPATGTYVENTSVTVSDGGSGFWANASRNMDVATNYINNGAYWKLREVSLSYDIPQSALGSLKYIKGATISVQGRNLFIFTSKYNTYTDPEYNFSDGNAIGITSLGQTPPTRFYGATLSLTF